MNQREEYDVKETEKQKQKTQIRVFGYEYVRAYIGLRTHASCMCTLTTSLREHMESCVRKHT